jgi:4-diphosphocytidyl-2C-methyl-D-erythritol kinase
MDEKPHDTTHTGLSPAAAVRMYREAEVAGWCFSNAFDFPVGERHPEIGKIRGGLLAGGATSARLTGSGSTVIGLFLDAGRAERCARAMSFSGRFSAVLRPLAGFSSIC